MFRVVFALLEVVRVCSGSIFEATWTPHNLIEKEREAPFLFVEVLLLPRSCTKL